MRVKGRAVVAEPQVGDALWSCPSPGPGAALQGGAGAAYGCPPGTWRGKVRSRPVSSHLDPVPCGQGPCWQSGPCFPLGRAVISPLLVSPAFVPQEGAVPSAAAILLQCREDMCPQPGP